MNSGLFLPLLLASSISLSSTLFYSDFNSILPKAYAEDNDCEDKAFEKYLKRGDKPFEQYLDKADDVPLPSDEDDYDEYLDEIEPLAEDYIDD